VVSIPACHAGDPGSIPGNGVVLIFFFLQPIRFYFIPVILAFLFFKHAVFGSRHLISKPSLSLRAQAFINQTPFIFSIFENLSSKLSLAFLTFQIPMPKLSEDDKSDGLDITSTGSLYNGPWDKKYWSSSRV
jgi:hypothetical protein